MSSTPDGVPAGAPPVSPPWKGGDTEGAWGELIVLSGEFAGARRLLQSSAVVLGQKEGCDYRLDDPDVSPVHAVLVRTPDGALLRDLSSDGGSYVNGESVAETTLRDGDLIALGGLQLEFHRLAVSDEETRLEQRRQALARQQTQLDAQFQARQRQLVRLRNDAYAATQALRAERNSYKKYVARTTISLDVARTEVAAAKEQARAERRRLLRVHLQLKKRTERHCLAERQALDDRARQLDAWQADLARAARNLQGEKEELLRARARFNGEMEIGRRHLQAGWNDLKVAQRQWEESRARQESELQESAQRLEGRIAEHETIECDLAEQRRHWGDRLRALQAEAEGLENRIGNQRRKLHEQEEDLNRLTAAAERAQQRAPQPIVAFAPLPADIANHTQRIEDEVSARLSALESLALELTEQREELATQAAQLERARLGWEEERRALAAELEPVARRLCERECQLRSREESLELIGREQQERREALDKLQNRLQARQTQLDVRRADWESERQRLLAQVHSQQATLHEEAADPLHGQVLCLQAQRETYERQIRTLSQEVERLACLLIDDEPSILALPTTRAA